LRFKVFYVEIEPKLTGQVSKMKSSDFSSLKEVVDLSVPMKSLDTPVFPGYPQPLRSIFTTVAKEGYASFVWTFAEHTSTHVDSPAHFFDGDLTIDQVPLNRYVGPGVVLDFRNKGKNYDITREDIQSSLKKIGRNLDVGSVMLFHTGYTDKSSSSTEWMEHPALSEDASKYIVELKVNAVGFDSPSPDHPPFLAHKILLPRKIAVFENLWNLDRVTGKDFIFVGAPLRLLGGSASPVRALAIVF
jgi:arylformamidase